MYDDLDYAAKRLNSTLVRLAATGDAFYVEDTFAGAGGRIKHHGSNLTKGEVAEVFHTDLDLTPIPLGFVNISKKMVFIMRKPMRRDWHQGLCHNNITTCGTIRPSDVQLSWLVQPMQNQYPNFQRAVRDLANRFSIAFSRDFGIVRDGALQTLRYRNYNVGTVENGVPFLAPNKMFLQQHLEEAVGA